MKLALVICAVLMACAVNSHILKKHEPHICDHDHHAQHLKNKLFNNPHRIANIENYRDDTLKATLLAADWEPMRITFNYDAISTSVDHAMRQFIEVELCEPNRKIFERLFKVKRNPNGVNSSKTTGSCFTAQIPNGTVDPNADLVIYVDIVAAPEESFVARASACDMDQGSYRPNVGWVQFNSAYTTPDPSTLGAGSEWVIVLENQISTAMHELTHVFGFSSWMYSYYQDANLNTRAAADVFTQDSQGNYFITTPALMNYASEYFQCNDWLEVGIPGIQLENGGGSGTAGSHWDRSALGDEAMTGSTIFEAKYSMFTGMLMEDTGWYNVDLDMVDEILWGYGEGCAFLSEKCNAATPFSDFCYTPQQSGCDADGSITTFCGEDAYSDGCNYWKDYSNGMKKAGEKCLTMSAYDGTSYGGQTFGVVCATDNQSFEVSYNGASIGTCTNGQTVDLYGQYTVQCPPSCERYCVGSPSRIASRVANKEADFAADGEANPPPAGTGSDSGTDPTVGSEPTFGTPEPSLDPPASSGGCADGQWECASMDQCISASFFCDGSNTHGNAAWGPDCTDGSDEVLEVCCGEGKYDEAVCPVAGAPSGCESGQWQCKSGECIPAAYVCDGTKDHPEMSTLGWRADCPDGSDETIADCCAINAGAYTSRSMC